MNAYKSVRKNLITGKEKKVSGQKQVIFPSALISSPLFPLSLSLSLTYMHTKYKWPINI